MVRTLSLMGAGLLALCVASAEAQQQVQVQPQQPARGIQKVQPRQAGDNAEQAAENAEQQGRVGRVRDLIGMDLLNQQGESLGMVDDLMINKRSGQVEFVLISQNKDSQDLHPVPWKAVTWYRDDKDQYLVLGMQPQKFQEAPVVVRDKWPNMTYSQWNQTYVPQVQQYYGSVQPPVVNTPITRRQARAIRRALD